MNFRNNQIIMTFLLSVFITINICVASEVKIKVMTFNIRYGTANDGLDSWQYRRQMVADVIKNSNSDIIGLQEALKFQVDELEGMLNEYKFLATYRDGKTKGQSNALLYRKSLFSLDNWNTFWLSDKPNKPDSKSWNNKESRFCTWMRLIEKNSGRGFYFYNVHLDHQCQYSREKSIVLICQQIKNREHNDPIVFMGDFNVYEDNPVIKFLTGKDSFVDDQKFICPINLADSFRTKHGLNADGGTFNGFGKREKFEKIDYIFIDQSTKVLDAEVIKYNIKGHFPSDHCPLTASVLYDNCIPN